MTELEVEINGYNIVAIVLVRARGSQFGTHEYRCFWEVGGVPCLQRVIKTLKASKYVKLVAVGTEDKKIADFVEKLGAVPIVRPLYTVLDAARDYTKGDFVRQKPRSLLSQEAAVYTNYAAYCFYYLKKTLGCHAEITVGCGANEPLGRTETLDRLIEAFFKDEEADMAWTFYSVLPEVFTVNPKTGRPFPLINSAGLDRQKSLPFMRRGPFDVHGSAAKSTYSESPKIASVMIPEWEAIDIHDKWDLYKANCYMKYRLEQEAKKKGGEIKEVKGSENKFKGGENK